MTERPTLPALADDRAKMLDELRQRIDTIDAAMHDLLIERSSIIDTLIEVKQAAKSGAAYRPGREASMMRRFAERHHGTLPLLTVEHLWREIISTFTYLQAPYQVHLAGSARPEALRDAARFYFGFTVPMIDHADVQGAIAAVRQSRSDLAILPLGDGEAWWRELDLEAAPRIIARLPFFVAEGRSGGEPAAIVSNPLDDPNAPEMMCYAATLAPTSDLGEAEFLARAPGGEVLFAVPAGTEAGDLPAGARPVGGYVRPLAIDGGKG